MLTLSTDIAAEGRAVEDIVPKVSALLHEAAETHHRVYRITDGADDDWATWYSDWLVRLSELPSLLGAPVVRSELTHMLVSLDREFTASAPGGRWEDHYAREVVARLGR